MNEIKEKFNNVIDSGGINEIYIGPEEEAPEEAKIIIDSNQMATPVNFIAESLDGNETDKAPSVQAVNNALLDIYSTEEVKTNKVWIDGKPIYRKTFVRGNSFSSFEHGIENVEHIWTDDEFTFRQHDSGNHISLNASGAQTYVYANPTTVEIKNTGAISAPYVYITLEYTKTTDEGVNV